MDFPTWVYGVMGHLHAVSVLPTQSVLSVNFRVWYFQFGIDFCFVSVFTSVEFQVIPRAWFSKKNKSLKRFT